MKNKLSVIIIAKNEEKNIGDCLDSISWADEIVLVDDYSDDNTEKIIKLKDYKNKIKVFKKKMDKGFGDQKNFALKQATSDWILSIDCDERVTGDLAAEIKIITNCGFGNNISAKAELVSRLTASQSTLTINDTSITKFERNKLVNRIFGNSIKNTFKTNEFILKNDNSLIGSSISHNGYEKNFGCTHKREIYLDQENNKLKGVDHIFKKSDGTPIRYVFRFHLNPELSAVKTMNGKGALIQISKNKSLLFTVKDENIEIEKSLYLGGKKILDNTCITISGNLVNKDKSFNWEIRKNI